MRRFALALAALGMTLGLHAVPAEAAQRPRATAAGVKCDSGREASVQYRLVNPTRKRVAFAVIWKVDGDRRVTHPVVRPRQAVRRVASVGANERGLLRVRAQGRDLVGAAVSTLICRAPRAYLGEARCRRGQPAQELWLDSRRGTLRSNYHWRLLRPSSPYVVEDHVRVAAGERVRVWVRPLHRYGGLWVGVRGHEVLSYGWTGDIPRC